VIVRFDDIGRIVDHHCLYFLFKQSFDRCCSMFFISFLDNISGNHPHKDVIKCYLQNMAKTFILS